MSEARLLEDLDRASVRIERHLADPPAAVWHAITDREALRSWFPCDVDVVGGQWVAEATITFRFPPEVIDLTLSGVVLAVDEPRLLAYTWGEETLRFELDPEERGTRLVLVDELPPGAAARNAAGWDDCLDRLMGVEPDPEAWKVRFAGYSAAFALTLGPQEGPPAGYKGGEPE